jgi:RimJ/RimL family protein N-acetyltransferase
MLIRTTTADDAEKLRELRLEALTNHPKEFSSTPEDALKHDWNERAVTGHGDHLDATFVAEKDGQLVGMTGIAASDRQKFPHSAYIWGVYVRPDFRGRGIAKVLVNAALQWAQKKGRTIVRLSAVATNPFAIRCYINCGFSIYGIEPASVVVDGVEYDEILMAKRLNTSA